MEDIISAWMLDPSYDRIRLASGALMTESYQLGKKAAVRTRGDCCTRTPQI